MQQFQHLILQSSLSRCLQSLRQICPWAPQYGEPACHVTGGWHTHTHPRCSTPPSHFTNLATMNAIPPFTGLARFNHTVFSLPFDISSAFKVCFICANTNHPVALTAFLVHLFFINSLLICLLFVYPQFHCLQSHCPLELSYYSPTSFLSWLLLTNPQVPPLSPFQKYCRFRDFWPNTLVKESKNLKLSSG